MLRTQYEKEVAQSHVTTQTKFNYAWGLVKSPIREHQAEGVQLLAGYVAGLYPRLVFVSSHTPPFLLADIYRSEPTRRRECLYYLALGHYKMGNFDEAKSFNCESHRSHPLRVNNRTTARSTSFRAGTNQLAGTVSRHTHRQGSQAWYVPSPSPFMTPCGKLAESQHRGIHRHGHCWWCCGRWHALHSRFGPSCHAQVIHSRYALLTYRMLACCSPLSRRQLSTYHRRFPLYPNAIIS